ncbi:SDR family oxidoreductase [Sabulicella glaciei]|uniref:SDR family oxidoreductase n=1 Tax=Sabulicella glaciei TaxID=2984948 RepID=A0ABT3P1N9_9PROT|nr:SDR family oxidoreductase [Roseococcus sp. MDT2-1-1]MCW8088334.1 SDR family oxidoreductase [Roseococcus sp. MDT2-1-1]
MLDAAFSQFGNLRSAIHRSRITVNIVAPGTTYTPMLRDPARVGTPRKVPPIGLYIRPGEVAALTTFILGPEAEAITRQQIMICGGSSL